MTELAGGAAVLTPSSAARWRAIRAVAGREWLELRRDRRLFWLGALYLLLMAGALAFGATESLRLQRERETAAVADRALWVGQSPKNPHAAAHFGQYAFKPVSPLALADPGVDAYVGSAVWLEAHKQNEARFRLARDSGVAARLGGLSLAFMLQIVAPMIVIITGFAAFSRERERGTLKQLLGAGARPTDLLAGKALALTGVAMLLLAPAMLGTGLCVILFAEQEKFPIADQLFRLAAASVGYLAYLGGFALLTLGVSARAGSSRAALILLLAFWLANGFLAPRFASDMARIAEPTPSAEAFRAAIARDETAASFGHDESSPAYRAFRDEMLKKYGVARVEDLPVSLRGLSLRRRDEIGYGVFDRHFGALQAAFERQDALRASPGFIFPFLAIQPLSMALAGSDSRSQFDFETSAEAHRRVIQNEVSDNLIHFAHNDAYVAGPELWRRIGAFAYRAPSVAPILSAEKANIGSLFLWIALTGGFAVFAARRMRPL
jgi:ABC-2 type transport system permease protein